METDALENTIDIDSPLPETANQPALFNSDHPIKIQSTSQHSESFFDDQMGRIFPSFHPSGEKINVMDEVSPKSLEQYKGIL